MRLAQGILITVVLAACWPGSAAASKARYTGSVQAGPALTGAGVAWVDGEYRSGPMFVRRTAGDAAPSTLFAIERKEDCDAVRDLSASGDLVVVERSTCAEGGRFEVLIGDGSGGPRVVESSGTDFVSCAISGSDVDAGLVAVARYNCQEAPIRLHAVAAGTSSDLPLTLTPGENPVEVRIAGRYVAVLVEGPPGTSDAPRFQVIVWDREAGDEAYRANADTFRGTDDWVVGSHRLELQPDGAVLYGFSAFREGKGLVVRYGLASPAAPALKEIPGSFDQSMNRLGFGDGKVALNRGGGTGSGVFGADGALLNLFSGRPTAGSIDFDGTRLAWLDWDYVYDEAYPYMTPAPGTSGMPPAPSPAPPAPAAVKTPAAPAASSAALKAVLKARALKAFSGTAADADGDLSLVRIGLVRIAGRKCQTLQSSGRLKSSPRSGGKCVPAVFLKAAGTAAWKFKLRRRLPAGRYALYVQAMDAAGHAQVVFTQAAGSLRTFRVK
jgi:hypothetical protein